MSWIYIPSKSAQASACLERDCELGSDTWASRIAPLLTLSGKHTLPASWRRAWKKAPWMAHLSGLIFSPSMADVGVESWIASLRDSRAKILASPEGARASMAHAPVSSSISLTLPTIAVRGASFWRTSQASLLPPQPLWTKLPPPTLPANATDQQVMHWESRMALYSKEQPPESWENWPTAGGMRNGSLFQRQTWAPVMDAPGGSAGLGETWTTPTALERSGQGERNSALTLDVKNWATPDCNTSTYSNGKMGPNIRQQASNWPTPQVGTGDNSHGQISGDFRNRMEELLQSPMWATPKTITGGANSQRDARGAGGPDLQEQVQSWPTPKATDGTKGGPNQAGSKGDLTLPSATAQWPTPTANQPGGTADAHVARKMKSMGRTHATVTDLGMVVQQWPTPAARDSKGVNSEEHALVTGGGRKHMDQLANFVAHSDLEFLRPDQQIPDGNQSSLQTQNSRRHLNPLFGSWLMGWPSTWVIAEPHASSALATALWRSALQQRLQYLLNDLE